MTGTVATPCRVYRGPLNAKGYGYPRLPGAGGAGGVLLHRWVVEQVEGVPLAAGEVVMHTCDNPPCFLYEHLRRATQSENLLDAVAKGRHRMGVKQGETNGAARLTADAVLSIRAASTAGETAVSLARRFGVSPSQVRNIVHRRKWRHL